MAPHVGGIIGNPLYGPGLFLGGFSTGTSTAWWSVSSEGLRVGTYFLFEAAFAAVTLALVGVVVLRKMKLGAFLAFAVVYFVVIWNLPAAWIWNPSGWLAKLGMVDLAGGLIVHGAAGAAGLAIMYQIWREERRTGLTRSPQTPIRLSPGWLTLAILLLWVGWFGFNPGSVLAFNDEAIVVVMTTFLAAAAAMVSLMGCAYLTTRENPGLLYAVNGILTGLIIITPLAGFRQSRERADPRTARGAALHRRGATLQSIALAFRSSWFVAGTPGWRAVRRPHDRVLHPDAICRRVRLPHSAQRAPVRGRQQRNQTTRARGARHRCGDVGGVRDLVRDGRRAQRRLWRHSRPGSE
jgi:Ammonium Transporter Family